MLRPRMDSLDTIAVLFEGSDTVLHFGLGPRYPFQGIGIRLHTQISICVSMSEEVQVLACQISGPGYEPSFKS